MINELRDLYQEVIFDHNRNPKNFRCIEHASCQMKGHNPLCGDELTLYLTISNDIITDASFQGCGCAISTASASLMTEAIIGKMRGEVHDLFKKFHNMVTLGNTELSTIGKLAVLSGVKEYPARVKCATLAWHTLDAALNNNTDDIITTE